MKKYIYVLVLFFVNILLAQQAEIAVSKRIDVEVITEKEIEKYENLDSNVGELHSRQGEVYRKQNEFLTKFKNQVSASYDEIVTRLGRNNDIRFVKEYNPLTSNFILRIRISAMFQEIPKDINVKGVTFNGEYAHGVYYVRTIFELQDPHTGLIVTMFPMHQAKYKTNNHLSADYVFREYWELFLDVALPRSNAEALRGLIKPKTTYSNVKIKYQPDDEDAKPIADGKQQGKLSLKKILPDVIGEAKNNSITKFKLTCEKGTFLETNTKEIEFTGADYYHNGFGGSNTYLTPYETYNCADYDVEGEKEHDTFVLYQMQCLGDEMEIEIKTEKIDFKCEETYDIILTYTAPGFARAKLVWKNTKIRFPEDGENIQFLDINAYKNSGATEHPNGTDGKPLDIPYSMIIPGIGKQTLYGWPESETATPEVLFVASLGGKGVYTKFKVNLAEDALNNCNISQIGNGPIYLDLGFDLFGKYPDDGGWQQEDVSCLDNKVIAMTGGTYSAYPVHFKQHKFSTQEIEKFKNSEEFDVTLSNGKATLKIEFKISE